MSCIFECWSMFCSCFFRTFVIAMSVSECVSVILNLCFVRIMMLAEYEMNDEYVFLSTWTQTLCLLDEEPRFCTHQKFLNAYMRCVESGVQSGLYLAPISRAFSLSSPLKGFWKPLRTNTTPSMIFLNGTCFAFCCFGSGLGLLSRFLSVDFCAGEATNTKVDNVFLVKKLFKYKDLDLGTFPGAGAWCAGWACFWFGGRSFSLRGNSGAWFLRRWRSRSRLPLFAELKFSFCWWLWGKKTNATWNFESFSLQNCWFWLRISNNHNWTEHVRHLVRLMTPAWTCSLITQTHQFFLFKVKLTCRNDNVDPLTPERCIFCTEFCYNRD